MSAESTTEDSAVSGPATAPDAPPDPPVTPERPTIICDDVRVTYRVLSTGARADTTRRLLKRGPRGQRMREVKAVQGATFVAHEGEAIALIGANGSGKSTLLRAMAGLVPLAGGRIWSESPPSLLGVNAALVNDLSGERNVILGGLALGMSPAEV